MRAAARSRNRGVRCRLRSPCFPFRFLLPAAPVLLCLLLHAPPLIAQPREAGRFRSPELVEIAALDSTIRLEIRYATDRNFMHRPMYAEARAFLQRPAAEALVRAHRNLLARGFGILVFDGYRPWSITKKFWDETPQARRKFVANPKKGSKHNRGCAVDVSIYEWRNGKEVEMPSPYDDFSARAAAGYPGGGREQRRLRDLLRTVMEKEGFSVNPDEWWHFDYREWRSYRILDIPFSEIVPSSRAGSAP